MDMGGLGSKQLAIRRANDVRASVRTEQRGTGGHVLPRSCVADAAAYLRPRVTLRRAAHDSPAERFCTAMTVATLASAPRLLMCSPQHFAVTYSINPWMDPAKWAGD